MARRPCRPPVGCPSRRPPSQPAVVRAAFVEEGGWRWRGRWRGGWGGGGGGGGGGAAGWPREDVGADLDGHCRARCPERRQRKQQGGSRQAAARWSRARHLKQRPAVIRMKSCRAPVVGRSECPAELWHREGWSHRASLRRPSRRRTSGAARCESFSRCLTVVHPSAETEEIARGGGRSPELMRTRALTLTGARAGCEEGPGRERRATSTYEGAGSVRAARRGATPGPGSTDLTGEKNWSQDGTWSGGKRKAPAGAGEGRRGSGFGVAEVVAGVGTAGFGLAAGGRRGGGGARLGSPLVPGYAGLAGHSW